MQGITLSRYDLRYRARGWIRKNSKIGPVFNIYVCDHEDCNGIDIQNRSLFQDRTASWVRIVIRVERYVNETTETMKDEEHGILLKPFAKARPRMKSTITLTPVSVLLRGRKWVDVNPRSYDHECYVISIAMTRLLRHDQNIPRETEDIVEEFNKKEIEVQVCFAMVGHSMIGCQSRYIGGIAIDPEPQDNVL